jgi:hypothetical protein
VRTVIRPGLLLDVLTGELLRDRALVIEGPRMRVAGAYLTCSGGGGDITGLAPDADAVVPAEHTLRILRSRHVPCRRGAGTRRPARSG